MEMMDDAMEMNDEVDVDDDVDKYLDEMTDKIQGGPQKQKVQNKEQENNFDDAINNLAL